MTPAEDPRRASSKAKIPVFNLRGFVQVISSAAVAACLYASVAAAEAVPVRDVMPAVTGDQTDLEILPKPKVETYSGRALCVERGDVQAGAFADSDASRELNLLLFKARADVKAEGAAAWFVLESAAPDKAKSWGGKTSDQGYGSSRLRRRASYESRNLSLTGEPVTIEVKENGTVGDVFSAEGSGKVLSKEGTLLEAADEMCGGVSPSWALSA